jgi:hypothetical protein
MQVPRGSDQKDDVVVEDDETEFVDAPSEPEDMSVDSEDDLDLDDSQVRHRRRSTNKTYVTASSRATDPDEEQRPEEQEASSLHVPTSQEGEGQKALGKRPVSTAESNNGAASGSTVGVPSVDAVSTTSLLRKADMNKAQVDDDPKSPSKGVVARVKKRSQQGIPRTVSDNEEVGKISRTKSNLRNLVKFDIPEDSKRAEIHLKAKAAQMTIQRASTKLRRQKLQDGLVVKMERMLVRVDAAGKDVPDDFDENGNQKVDSRVKDKWREYMVVCRQSISEDADFVLQMYKTRVSL